MWRSELFPDQGEVGFEALSLDRIYTPSKSLLVNRVGIKPRSVVGAAIALQGVYEKIVLSVEERGAAGELCQSRVALSHPLIVCYILSHSLSRAGVDFNTYSMPRVQTEAWAYLGLVPRDDTRIKFGLVNVSLILVGAYHLLSNQNPTGRCIPITFYILVYVYAWDAILRGSFGLFSCIFHSIKLNIFEYLWTDIALK